MHDMLMKLKKGSWCEYAPPGIPGTDVGERRGICHRNLPQGVGTWSGLSQSTQTACTFSFVVLENSLWIPQIPISPYHTLYTTGRYGVFVKDLQGDGMEVCAPGMGACSIWICQFPS